MYDIYSNDNNDLWRYTLGKSGKKPLFIVGLNPSTATREKGDPTVTRVERVAKDAGFDGFVMLNLYPVRATKYQDLPVKADAQAYAKNLDAIEEAVSTVKKPVIWAAWGQSVLHHGFFLKARDELYGRLAAHHPQWKRFGELTIGGHPRHPSRLNYSWSLEPLDIET